VGGFTNTNRDAAKWLATTDGRWEVAWFLVKFSAAGSLLSLLVVVPRQIASGVFRERATVRHWLGIAAVIFASVAVVGAPGAALLWWLGAEVFPAPGSTAVAYITLAPIVLLVGFFLLNSLFIGVTSWASETGDREWWARAGGWVGAVALTWLALHASSSGYHSGSRSTSAPRSRHPSQLQGASSVSSQQNWVPVPGPRVWRKQRRHKEESDTHGRGLSSFSRCSHAEFRDSG
jgi:hypothetical protein